MQLSVHLKSQSPIRECILRVINSFICLRKLRQTSSLRPGFGCRLLGQILRCSGGNLSLGTSKNHPRTRAKTHADLVFPNTGRNPIVECHLFCAEMQNAPEVCGFEAKKLNKSAGFRTFRRIPGSHSHEVDSPLKSGVFWLRFLSKQMRVQLWLVVQPLL